MNKILALACVLLPVAALAQTPNEASGSETAPPPSQATPTTTPSDATEAAPAAGAAQAQSAQEAAAAEPEMSPEEAAKAAKEGKLQYSKDVTNPSEATAAEIAAHNATAAPEDRITCKKVRPTGSNRPMKFCSTPKQRQAMREAAQQGMDTSGIDDIGRRGAGKLETMAPRGGR